MPFARVNNNEIVEVGLPDNIRGYGRDRLVYYGWRPIVGRPNVEWADHKAPYTYDPERDVVYGTWQQTDIREENRETRILQIRNKRDELLNKSDYAVLPDAPVTDVEEWKTYRQALRDIPQQPGFPSDIDWPKKPS